ncbi:MAG: sugar phosphate isomerase/epimerase [Cyclobacteriaceae bacterium]|nr:sugar phosphate isomerase/epimerase [Cyclobacteriaceae bacterium]
MKRRDFIQTSALAIAGSAIVFPALSAATPKLPVGIQLYTLRDVIMKDPKGVVKMLADLGYKDLETYGYGDGKLFGMPSKEFSDYVKSLGMRITSGHYGLGKAGVGPMGSIRNGWESAVVDAKEAGQEYMVLAYLTKEERASMDSYKGICDEVNKAAEVCKKYGVRMNYHNHDFEFEKFDGEVAYDMMLKRLDPKLVDMELDLYWTIFAGVNPVDLFAKHPGRFVQWHVKDMDKTDNKKNAISGTGSIDFKSLMKSAKQSGLKHWYMEYDNHPVSSTESVKESIGYLKTL